MNVFEAIILGLLQGITEFIPVSSSGHLTLFGRVFEIDSSIMLSYTTLLHVGTLIAVFIVMRKDIKGIILDIFGKMTWLIVVATIPAVAAALLLGDFIEEMFAGNTLGYQFLMTGIILLSTLMIKQEANNEDKADTKTLAKELSYKEALIAGAGQAFAIMPGISRSGSTLAALLFCRVNRRKAVRFSFLMSIPAIAGGFLLDIIKLFNGETTALTELSPLIIIVGVAAAFISGLLAMNYMLKKLTSKGLLTFAIYVLIMGVAVLVDQNWLHIVFQ